MSAAPFYTKSQEEAVKNGELTQYEDSMKRNIACARAIARAIDSAYSKPLEESVKGIIRQYGNDRIRWVTAVSVQTLDDGRFCRANKDWAMLYSLPAEKERASMLIHVHPAKLDNFATQVRTAYGTLCDTEQNANTAEPEQGDGMMLL